MPLSDPQLIILGDNIRANPDPDVMSWLADGADNDIATWYSDAANQAPEVWVLVDSLTRDQVIASMDWAAEYDPGFKDDMTAIVFLVAAQYDPRPAGNRHALNAVFAGASNTKTAVLAAATRAATPAESLYITPATGPGGGDGSSQGQSALAVFSGSVSSAEVSRALRLTV
jgi:hypothetical protein